MATEITQQALILHRRPYRETSLIVTFLTPEHGKLNAVVRGVRGKSCKGNPAQAKQAWLQPFQVLNISWLEKSSLKLPGLVNLRQLEPTQVRFPLLGESNLCGLYVNELLYRLLYPHIAIEVLFESYQQTLYDLAVAKDRLDQSWALRQFEYELLKSMGYALQLATDSKQLPIKIGKNYHYYPEIGAVAIDPLQNKVSCNPSSYVEISGECLLKFSQLKKCDSCLQVWKKLFRILLARYLGGKPIQTRALFQP